MEKTKNTERMSWDKIKEKYPDKWVGLTEVKWEKPNSPNVESAVVSYVSDDKDEIISRRLTGERVCAIYTTPQNLGIDIGFLM